MKEKALFISNKKYIDNSCNEGGVKYCTLEFIDLISQKFDLMLYQIDVKNDFLYKLKVRFNLNVYEDYNPDSYVNEIIHLINENKIKYVFLNMSNTVLFAKKIKEIYLTKVKIILCSHGNDSGDFLHTSVRFYDKNSFIFNLFSSRLLGKMMKMESLYRILYIDVVLCISEIETAIENWIGAKKSIFLPRVLKQEFVEWNPVLGRVGFLGDLSHPPNFYGIDSYCYELSKAINNKVIVRIVGGPSTIGLSLQSKYSFVEYCGYLSTEDLLKEVVTWSVFLNPVFYYSRGASTKLAKALSWGLPVISTKQGNRGYSLPINTLVNANNPENLVELTLKVAFDIEILLKMSNVSKDLVISSLKENNILLAYLDEII